jgi:hypothetical protein
MLSPPKRTAIFTRTSNTAGSRIVLERGAAVGGAPDDLGRWNNLQA